MLRGRLAKYKAPKQMHPTPKIVRDQTKGGSSITESFSMLPVEPIGSFELYHCFTWHFHVAVQFSHSVVQLFVSPWTAARQDSRMSIANSQSLFKLMSIESVIPSNHLVLCCPLLLLPSIFPSIRVFIRWPKYWSFSFSISPSNEYSGLTSFKIDWLDLLAVQGTLKSLLQHHS